MAFGNNFVFVIQSTDVCMNICYFSPQRQFKKKKKTYTKLVKTEINGDRKNFRSQQ